MGGSQGAWGPDPFGRHQLRYWDGSRWTEHVADDGVPDLDDPVVPAPLTGTETDVGWPIPQPSFSPARVSGPPPARIGRRGHIVLAVFSVGLWLLIVPSLMLWRRGRPRASLLAGAGALAVVIGLANGSTSPTPPAPQSLVGQAIPSTRAAPRNPAPASTSKQPAGSSAAPASLPTTAPRQTTRVTAPTAIKTVPKKTSTSKKPTVKKTTASPAQPADRDCGDFATHAQAQAWFDKYFPYYGDFANLDADGDGKACESLP